MSKQGELHIVIGPMFSSKSSKLIMKLARYADIGMKVLYINSADDFRQAELNTCFSTHSSQLKGVKFVNDLIFSIKSKNLQDIHVTDYDVIGIDEAQFFEDLADTVKIWVNDFKKIVVCVGLDADANMNKFGQILDLIPLCNTIKKSNKATCSECLSHQQVNIAPFTGRIACSNNQKEVGGIELYKPLCRYHHQENIKRLLN